MPNTYHLHKNKKSTNNLLLLFLPSIVFVLVLAVYFLTAENKSLKNVNNNIKVEVLGESNDQ